jgi:hypothetical protein
MNTKRHPTQKGRHSGAARLSVFLTATALMIFLAAPAFSQSLVRFDKSWWNSLSKNERWDFVYGYTECGPAIQSWLNMQQYEDFVSDHVTADADSVPQLIRLAPHKVKPSPHAPGGEVYPGRHGFKDGGLWGDNADEGRAWVAGYLACEGRPAYLPSVDRYVRLIIRHYANSKRESDKLANVLEPLLPPRKVPVP